MIDKRNSKSRLVKKKKKKAKHWRTRSVAAGSTAQPSRVWETHALQGHRWRYRMG